MADAEEKKKMKEQAKAEKLAKKEAKKADKLARKEAKMAKKQGKAEGQSQNDQEQTYASGGLGLITWIVLAVVVLASSGSGFFLGRIVAAGNASGKPGANQENPVEQSKKPAKNLKPLKSWSYALDPVVANLNESSLTRFVRVTIMLEVNGELDETEGRLMLDKKKPLIVAWLNMYLKGLTLEDVTGDRNMHRIRIDILDAFNEKLFPGSKPMISDIYTTEFVVQ